jgi:hypothetical protein
MVELDLRRANLGRTILEEIEINYEYCQSEWQTFELRMCLVYRGSVKELFMS